MASTTPPDPATESRKPAPLDFVRQIVADDRTAGRHQGRVVTRFPPEPNGFLHIGHAKSICLNFGLAGENQGACFLRFDDTNPMTEDVKFIESIQEDVRWLGFDWADRLRFASDYYDDIYACAEELIRLGKAFVDSSTPDQIREMRGKPGEAGKPSPDRDRSPEYNLALFRRMRSGELPDGAMILRAKIDMASPNFNMRDPALYRIRHQSHPRTGDTWRIYPMYDFAHPISDALEGTTHSICTLEFEDHRPLYDWILDELKGFLEARGAKSRPQQIEFAKLAIDYIVTSKRRLKELVGGGFVNGWDDPRFSTLAGLRRRGVPAAALRALCEKVGLAKNESVIEHELLDHCIREDLDRTTRRAMCVLHPLEVEIIDLSEGDEPTYDAPYHPTDPTMGHRPVRLARKIFIEQSDFMMEPPKKFFRLGPGREVRLRWGPIIKCEEVVQDDAGNVIRLRCTHDAATLPGAAEPKARKVKGTIHWVPAHAAVPVEARLYDRLWLVAQPGADPDVDYKMHLNPSSLEVLQALGEPSLVDAKAGDRFQFERTGYFSVDPDSTPGKLVCNRTVGLRDSWSKADKKADD